MPTYDEFCLARVASISAYGVDPSSDKTGGTDVWAGPLAQGAFVFGLLNRNAIGSGSVVIKADWSMLGMPPPPGSVCVRELYSGRQSSVKASDGVSWAVAPHDLAVLRVVPGASTC